MYQKSNHDKHAQNGSFVEGEEVYVKSYGQCGQRWLEGCVVTLRGPVSALVELTDGSRIRRYFDQMRKQQQETHTSTPAVSRDYLSESFLPSGSDELFDSGTDARESEDVVPEVSQDSSQVALPLL